MKIILTNGSVVRLMCVVAMWLTCTYGMGQVNLGDVAKEFETTPLPYYGGFTRSYGVDNSSGAIPNRLDKNFQLTQFTLADDADTAPAAYCKFQVPKRDNEILAIEFGGATCHLTGVLALLDQDGVMVDTLECCVGFCQDDWFYAKQYRILSDGSIIVTALEPTEQASVPFRTFKEMRARRVDYIYKVWENKFLLTRKLIHEAQTYTYGRLADKDYNLWDGDEKLLFALRLFNSESRAYHWEDIPKISFSINKEKETLFIHFTNESDNLFLISNNQIPIHQVWDVDKSKVFISDQKKEHYDWNEEMYYPVSNITGENWYMKKGRIGIIKPREETVMDITGIRKGMLHHKELYVCAELLISCKPGIQAFMTVEQWVPVE